MTDQLLDFVVPEAALFDFDGVIVDSLAAHFAAWRVAVQDVFGVDHPRLAEWYKGHSTRNFGKIIAAHLGDDRKAEIVTARKIEALATGTMAVACYPGVTETFRYLVARKLPFAIASNAPREFVHQTLKSLDLFQVVPHALGREDAPRSKPHPDLYLEAARRLGLNIHQQRATLVFEDSLHGLKAAWSARMIPIGVTTQHSSPDLIAAKAIATCPSVGKALESGWFEKFHLSPRTSS